MLWNFESPYDSFIPKWSQARQDSWDLCERQFFYRYRAVSVDSRHPQKSKIISLKQRRTIPVMQGEIVHRAIRDLLTTETRSSSFELSRTLDRVWGMYLATPENSLTEFVNGRGLSSVLLAQYKQECLRLLENFNSLWKQLEGDEVVYIENHDSYPGWFLCGNIAVYARPDIILKRDKYLILDWKTGVEPDDYSDNTTEMSTSIYLACTDFEGRSRAGLNEIEGSFAYLTTSRISPPLSRTEKDFEVFTEAIRDKVDAMHVSLIEEHYTPDSAKWKCRACNFATICHDGKEYIE